MIIAGVIGGILVVALLVRWIAGRPKNNFSHLDWDRAGGCDDMD